MRVVEGTIDTICTIFLFLMEEGGDCQPVRIGRGSKLNGRVDDGGEGG